MPSKSNGNNSEESAALAPIYTRYRTLFFFRSILFNLLSFWAQKDSCIFSLNRIARMLCKATCLQHIIVAMVVFFLSANCYADGM